MLQPFRTATSLICAIVSAGRDFPDRAPGDPWGCGTSVDYLRRLVAYWRDGFDWRVRETRLNAFPQFKVLWQEIDLHFLVGEPPPRPLSPA